MPFTPLPCRCVGSGHVPTPEGNIHLPQKNTCCRVLWNTGRPLRQLLLSKEKPTTGASSLVTFTLQHTLEITAYFLHLEHLDTEGSGENVVSPQRQLNEPPAPQALREAPLPHPCASQSKSGVCPWLPCCQTQPNTSSRAGEIPFSSFHPI